MLRRFMEKLLYSNRKVIVSENNGSHSLITTFNLDPDDRIRLAVATICELVKADCEYYNIGYKEKAEIVTNIIESIGEHTGVDININEED